MKLTKAHEALLRRIAKRPTFHEELAFSEGILLYLPQGGGLIETGLVRERRGEFHPTILKQLAGCFGSPWRNVLTVTPAGREALKEQGR